MNADNPESISYADQLLSMLQESRENSSKSQVVKKPVTISPSTLKTYIAEALKTDLGALKELIRLGSVNRLQEQIFNLKKVEVDLLNQSNQEIQDFLTLIRNGIIGVHPSIRSDKTNIYALASAELFHPRLSQPIIDQKTGLTIRFFNGMPAFPAEEITPSLIERFAHFYLAPHMYNYIVENYGSYYNYALGKPSKKEALRQRSQLENQAKWEAMRKEANEQFIRFYQRAFKPAGKA